jgi:ribonucleoside-diphosphate reductase alpha chain
MGALLSEERDDEERQVREQFDQALIMYQTASGVLREAVRAMHKLGVYPPPPEGVRFRLSDEREGKTHKVEIGYEKRAIKGYISSGTYCDGTVGEIFLEAEKMGTFESGILDAFATVFSIALQYGVPLERLIDKFRYTRFEPSGMTKNEEITSASSVIDYLMQWLGIRYTHPRGDKDGRDRSTT